MSTSVTTTAALDVHALTREAFHDFRRSWAALVVFEAGFKLIEAWLLVPAVAALLTAILARTGRVAVSNRDILDFLLTPAGLLYAALLAAATVSLWLVQQAGVMVVADLADSPERRTIGQLVVAALRKSLGIVQLGALKAALLATALVPFALLAVLTYFLLLTRHDIYFYWTERPPAFQLAVGIGGLLLLAAVVAGVWLSIRWSLALPIALFESQLAPAALRESRDRTRGVRLRVGLILIGWPLVALLLGIGLEAGFRGIASTVLESAGERPTVLILLLLALKGGLLAGVSFVAVVGQGLLTRRVYLRRG